MEPPLKKQNTNRGRTQEYIRELQSILSGRGTPNVVISMKAYKHERFAIRKDLKRENRAETENFQYFDQSTFWGCIAVEMKENRLIFHTF
jgi:hypothetical protein